MGQADESGDATPFVEFMLLVLLDSIQDAASTDQVNDHVTDQVARTIEALAGDELGRADLMIGLELSHRPTFWKNYLDPALDGGWIERTQPDSPRSPTQCYRLTDKGRRWLRRRHVE